MLKNRIFYVFILLTAILIYIFTNTYYTLTLLLLVIAVPSLSLIFMLFSYRQARIEIEVAPTMEKGDVNFNLVLINNGILPIARLKTVAMIDNQLMDMSVVKKILSPMPGKSQNEIKMQVENAKVGNLTIRFEDTSIQDVFSLFSVKIPSPETKNTIVYPSLKDIEIHMDRPVKTWGETGRYSPDEKGSDVSEIFSLREYEPGDEIRKIHWKMSGKVDKTIIRDFSLPLNYSVFLLIELNKTNEKNMDAIVELYLSLSKGLLAEGINHNLAWYDEVSERLRVFELDDFADLEVAIAEFLMSFSYDNGSHALEYYTSGGYRNDESLLLYLSTELDIEKILEVETTQNMKTIFISEEEDSSLEGIEVYIINPDHIESGLPQFII